MNRLSIVKIGGTIIESDEILKEFLTGFAAIKGPRILVHGGGKMATELAKQLGFHTTMIEGRRVTDLNMLRVVTMAYAGLANKRLVSRLQGMDINGLGLTGADGNLIESVKRPLKDGIDWGWVGDPVFVNKDLLNKLLQSEIVPVIAPLTHDGNGHMLNTNADTMANMVATALSDLFQVDLIYTFELPGVMKDIHEADSLIPFLNQEIYQQYLKEGIINDGMKPKLDNAFQALNAGVHKVKIIRYSALKDLEIEKFDNYTTISL